jgi:hypothetical protein
MTVGFVLDASCQNATSSNLVASGRAALISNDIITANIDFSNAVVASSSDPDANFFYSATRIAVLPCETNSPVGAVAQLLSDYGVPLAGRDLWMWSAELPRNLYNEVQLPATSPTEGVAVGILITNLLPEIIGALDNLAQVSTNYTVTLSNEVNRPTPVVLSNADVLVYEAGLEAAAALLLTVNSYDLNVSITALQSNITSHTFNFSNDVLAAYPGLLEPEPGANVSLPEAGSYLNAAISNYVSGAGTIQAEKQNVRSAVRQEAIKARAKTQPSPQLHILHFHHLTSTNTLARLLEIQSALSSNTLVSLGTLQGVAISELLNLADFFSSSPINLAAKEPQTMEDPLSGRPRIVYDSIPDPTFGGILPEFDEQSWMSLLRSPAVVLPGDTNWEAALFGPAGLDCEAWAVAASGNNVYVAGCFDAAGTTNNSVNNIALWNGSSWSALGSGVNNVFALAASGNNLYVGGNFTDAGGVAANNIAVWNGSSWSALGSGVSGVTGIKNRYVTALAVSGNNVYVGGSFTNAGGVAANNIAMWNGSSWSALGSGVSGGQFLVGVDSLAVSGTNLYVGGSFTNAGGVAANSIAVWNGSSWSALGSGVDGSVSALLVSGTNLYVGGSFMDVNAGDVAATNIAVWDGNNWSALAGGVGNSNLGYVNAMAVSGTNLYVGGNFTNADVESAINIAVWNGASWSSMGSGVGSANGAANDYEWVDSMAAVAGNLFVSGYFGSAGGWKASNLALWQINPEVCEFSLGSTGETFGAAGGSGSVTVNDSANCTWTATAGDGFITITAGSSGTGNGTVSYTVAPNTGAARSGTIAIGGKTFTVAQAEGASKVTYSLTNVVQSCKTNKKTGATTCTVDFNLVVDNTGSSASEKSTVLLWLEQGSILNPHATGAPAPLTEKLAALKAGKSKTIKFKSKKLTGSQTDTYIFATDTSNNILAVAEVPSPSKATLGLEN